MMRRIREYFLAEEVLEVDTPALGPFAVSDTQIESFSIADSAISGPPLYLHTSPEFCMKRLLAAGYPDIYSICRVFRDGEAGRKHQPEFTMIEWYRLEMSLRRSSATLCNSLTRHLGIHCLHQDRYSSTITTRSMRRVASTPTWRMSKLSPTQ